MFKQIAKKITFDKHSNKMFNYSGDCFNHSEALWETDDCTRKGKPAVRWGHKAVSLSPLRDSVAVGRDGRLSGCRRRSEKVNGSTHRDHRAGRVLGQGVRPADGGDEGGPRLEPRRRYLFCHRRSRTLRHFLRHLHRQLGSALPADSTCRRRPRSTSRCRHSSHQAPVALIVSSAPAVLARSQPIKAPPQRCGFAKPGVSARAAEIVRLPKETQP